MHEKHRERMKNKMITHSDSLLPHEVLETLLFYSIPRKNTNDIAHNLLNKFDGSIKNVLEADPEILQTIDGVGLNTACFLKTINNILKSISEQVQDTTKIKSLYDAKIELRILFKNTNKEKLIIIFLGSDNKVLGKYEYSSNFTDYVEINMSEIAKHIVLHKPSAVLVAHNHLSGNVLPSRDDNLTTKKLYALLSINGVAFYDHLIYTEEDCFSYFGTGKLDEIKNSLGDIV